MAWLVSYDISCPKRWRKVYKNIYPIGYRLQYSLFWLPCSNKEILALYSNLEKIINPHRDDIRFYPFSNKAWARLYGPPPWTEGVIDPFYQRFVDCWRKM